jgi:CheY-like chemotaxis protein
LKPDVIVLNVTMPVTNGFEAARAIKTILPEFSDRDLVAKCR